MAALDKIVAYCDKRLRIPAIADFPGALNGLQAANSGRVTKIGATVDAGAVPFALAAKAGVDFLIVHHGMFWDGAQPATGANYRRLKTWLDADCAVYSAHLPLDAHPQIGNNALIAQALGLKISRWGIVYQGTPIAAFISKSPSRTALRGKLEQLSRAASPPSNSARLSRAKSPSSAAVAARASASCAPPGWTRSSPGN